MYATTTKDNATSSPSSRSMTGQKEEGSVVDPAQKAEQPFFAPANSRQSGTTGGHTTPHTSFFQPRTQPVIQPKLTINEPGDQYEQEADAMADRVMRMSDFASPLPADKPAVPPADKNEKEAPTLRRMPQTPIFSPTGVVEVAQRSEKEEEEEQVQRKEMPFGNAWGSEPVIIQRKCAACEEEEKVQRQEMEGEEPLQTKPLMRKAADGGYSASPQLSSQLNSSKGGGDPLPGNTLGFMNQAFGADFSSVRVHTGNQAAEMSQGIQAKAFTHGSDVYFNQGQYNPESSEGKRLLSHELVHVVQQGNDVQHMLIKRKNNETQNIQREEENPAPAKPYEGERTVPDEKQVVKELEKWTALESWEYDKIAFYPSLSGNIAKTIEIARQFAGSKKPDDFADSVLRAKTLLRVYYFLKGEEHTSKRSADGTLVFVPFMGKETSWAPGNPKTVEAIVPFSPENVQDWIQIVCDSAKTVNKRSKEYAVNPDLLSIDVDIKSEADYYRLNYFASLVLNKYTVPNLPIERGEKIIEKWKYLFTYFGWQMTPPEFKMYVNKKLTFALDKDVLAVISINEGLKFRQDIQNELDSKNNSNKKCNISSPPYNGGIWEDVTCKALLEYATIDRLIQNRYHAYMEYCNRNQGRCKVARERYHRYPGETYRGHSFIGVSPWPHPATFPFAGYLLLTNDRRVLHLANDTYRKDEILTGFAGKITRDTEGALFIAKWAPWAAVTVIGAAFGGAAVARGAVTGATAVTRGAVTVAKAVAKPYSAASELFVATTTGIITAGGLKNWLKHLTTAEGVAETLINLGIFKASRDTAPSNMRKGGDGQVSSNESVGAGDVRHRGATATSEGIEYHPPISEPVVEQVRPPQDPAEVGGSGQVISSETVSARDVRHRGATATSEGVVYHPPITEPVVEHVRRPQNPAEVDSSGGGPPRKPHPPGEPPQSRRRSSSGESAEVREETIAEREHMITGRSRYDLPIEEGLTPRVPWEPPPGAAPRPLASATPDVRRAWLRQRLQLHVEEGIRRFEVEGLTPRQAARVGDVPAPLVEPIPELYPAFRGSRIDQFAKDSVIQDPDLAEVITAPDFVSEPDFIDSILPDWFDATTHRQWAAHLRKYQESHGDLGHRIPAD